MKKFIGKIGLQKIIGIAVLFLGVVLTTMNNFVDTNNILGIIGVLMAIGGLYTWLIKCEKHQYLKMALGFIGLSILLSWLIPSGYYSNSSYTSEGFKRIGLFSISTYIIYAFYYFYVLFTYLFILSGFYSVLKKTAGYQVIIHKLIKNFSKNKMLFVAISMFVFAVLTAFATETYAMLVFIPFALSIAYGVTKDKILSFISTFGGILVGIVGSIFSLDVVGVNVTMLKVSYTANTIEKIVLFVVAYALMLASTVLYMKKSAKNTPSKNESIDELFEVDVPQDKAKSLSMVITLSIFALIVIVALIPWNTVFKLNWAVDFHTWLTTVKLFDSPAISYILGPTSALGSWNLFDIQGILLLATVVVALVSKMKFNSLIEYFIDGIKKSAKYVLQFVLIYLFVEFALLFPVIPTVVKWIMELFKGASVIFAGISAFISSIFGVEFQYSANLSATYIFETFSSKISGKELAILYQSVYGLVQFVAPTSLMLILGLSYLDIPYRNWLKFIWKFLLGLLIVIILMFVAIIFIF